MLQNVGVCSMSLLKSDEINFEGSPIFITGLPRSGTSMIGGIISKLGVFKGKTVAGGSANPRGFFENIFIREHIIKSILRTIDCDPLGVQRLPPVNFFIKLNTDENVPLDELLIENLLQEGYNGQNFWMYKDAKLTLMWRIFHHYFPRAHWVVVRRKREDFIRSCKKTSFMFQHSDSEAYWHNFADQYEARLTSLIMSVNSVSEFSADKIIAGDFVQIKSFCDRIGLDYSYDVIKNFVDPNIWKRNEY